MKSGFLVRTLLPTLLAAITALGGVRGALAAESRESEAKATLNALYESRPAAKALGAKAKAILVFPDVRKGGIILGGQSGEGVLLKNGKLAGRYRVDGLLVGLEVGAQSFAYTIFFMSDAAFEQMRATHGLEIGTDPNIVLVDSGAAKEVTTGTTQADVYAYVTNQKGLMGGISVQGLKFTEIER